MTLSMMNTVHLFNGRNFVSASVPWRLHTQKSLSVWPVVARGLVGYAISYISGVSGSKLASGSASPAHFSLALPFHKILEGPWAKVNWIPCFIPVASTSVLLGYPFKLLVQIARQKPLHGDSVSFAIDCRLPLLSQPV